MTTSEGEANPAEPTATNTETAPGSELSSRAVTGDDAPETAPLTGNITATPDDARQLELEIERTREQLGETVQELAARVDVKGRAQAKAFEVSRRLKSTVAQARNRAATRAGGVRSQVARNTAAAQQKTASVGRARRDQLRGRVAATAAPASKAAKTAPEQVRRAVTKGASGAREHWIPLSVAAGVVIVGCLAVWQWKPCQRPRAALRSDPVAAGE